MKVAYFVLLSSRVIDGPHKEFSSASVACQELNSRLSTAPFAYVRRTHTAKETKLWSELALEFSTHHHHTGGI